MVLKVVRGKILETWELSRPRSLISRSEAARLSKIEDYLPDNLSANTLSRIEGRDQRKSGRVMGVVLIWELGI